MNSQNLSPYSLSFPGIPTAGAIAEQGIHTAPLFNYPSPLATMAQKNIPPRFYTGSYNVRSDYVMEKLLKYGYVIESLVYKENKLYYFLVKTRLGDRALIEIDNIHYRDSFPIITTRNTIQLKSKSNIKIIPQTISMGVEQCLNYDVCGTAFICNDNICISSANQEENYVLQSTNNLTGIYPVVPLSVVLSKPVEIEEKIAKILEDPFKKVEMHREYLDKTLYNLQKETINLKENLNKQITELENAYNSIKHISPETLPDKSQADYYAIQKLLADKKTLRNKLVDMMMKGGYVV